MNRLVAVRKAEWSRVRSAPPTDCATTYQFCSLKKTTICTNEPLHFEYNYVRYIMPYILMCYLSPSHIQHKLSHINFRKNLRQSAHMHTHTHTHAHTMFSGPLNLFLKNKPPGKYGPYASCWNSKAYAGYI